MIDKISYLFVSIKCPLMMGVHQLEEEFVRGGSPLVIHRDVMITCVEFTLPCRYVLFCLNQKVSDVT